MKARARSWLVGVMVAFVAMSSLAVGGVAPAYADVGVPVVGVPVVTGLSPKVGRASSVVTITGTFLTDGGGVPVVKFGSHVAKVEEGSTSATQLTVYTPDVAWGPVDVTVTTSAGTSVVSKFKTSRFTFVSDIAPVSLNAYPDRGAYYYNTSASSAPGIYSDWMADPRLVPDDKRLNQVSMPGTHDTGAFDQYTETDLATTQTMNIPTQLKAGIHAIDLRVGGDSGCSGSGLHLHHGDDCLQTFSLALQQIRTYLKEHPTEFIVARIGNSGTTAGVQFDACVAMKNSVLVKNADGINPSDGTPVPSNYFYQDPARPAELDLGYANPLVRDLRGKIYFINDFGEHIGDGYEKDGKTCFFSSFSSWSAWGGGAMNSQDESEVNFPADRFSKWKAIKAQFDEQPAKLSRDPYDPAKDVVWTNWLSASQVAGSPLDEPPCSYTSGTQRFGCRNDSGYQLVGQTYGVLGLIPGACTWYDWCNDMVRDGLYQLSGCYDDHATAHSCEPRYVGFNMMAEAYIAGSTRSGSTDWERPTDARRAPQFNGVNRPGIVYADFPGDSLIRSILSTNSYSSSLRAYATEGSPVSSWYNHPVTVAFECTGDFADVCPPIQKLNGPGLVTSTPETRLGVTSNVVSVQIDTDPPTFTQPNYGAGDAFEIDANTSLGGVPNFHALLNAHDATSAAKVTCTNPDGSAHDAIYLVGTTDVQCTVTDNAGNVAEPTAVRVRVKPTITAAVTTAPNSWGWYRTPVTVRYTCAGVPASACSADDTLSGEGQVSSTPRSISAAGLTAFSNVVTVRIDTQAPTVVSPARVDADAIGPNGTSVTYRSGGLTSFPVHATDATSAVMNVPTCSPTSGTTFAIGTTNVTCTVSDFAGNAGSATFPVHVKSPVEMADDIVADVNRVAPGTSLASEAADLRSSLLGEVPGTACDFLVSFTASAVSGTSDGVTLQPSDAAAWITKASNVAATIGCSVKLDTTTSVHFYSPSESLFAKPGETARIDARVTAGPLGAASGAGGKVQFYVNGVAKGLPVAVQPNPAMNAGVASLFLPVSKPGTVTATFLGTSSAEPSTSNATKIFIELPTTTSLSASTYAPVFGQPLKLTATVKSVGTVATGSVSFFDAATLLGTGTVVNGAATLTVPSPLGVGVHDLTARYNGPQLADSGALYDPSTSAARQVLVTPAATITKLAIPTSSYGTPTAITATVTAASPSAAVPTGTVTFSDGSGPLGAPVALDQTGKAAITVVGPIGIRTITATYTPGAGFASSSGQASQTIRKAATTVTLTAQPNPVRAGVPVTLHAAIGPEVGSPTGSVTFSEGTMKLGVGASNNGSATATVTFTTLGTHTVRASYAGDLLFNAAKSNTLDVVVVDPTNNDNFASATPIAGLSGSVDGTNVDATTEAGELGPRDQPDLGWEDPSPYHSVWYAWTAPATVWVTFDTCSNTNFDTLIGVWTGSQVNGLTNAGIVGNSGSAGCDYRAGEPFNAISGQTYYIQVDSDDASNSGSFTLHWNSLVPPANDAFADAEVVSGQSGTRNGTLDGTTYENGEPSATSSRVPNHSVWYSWTAPFSGTATFDTCGSTGIGLGTRPAAYTVASSTPLPGSTVPPLTEIGRSGSLDYCGGGANLWKVSFAATAGTTYEIQVVPDSVVNPSYPEIVLGWNLVSNDAFATAKSLAGATGSVDGANAGYTSEGGEPASCDGGTGCSGTTVGPNATAWYTWTAPHTGTATLSTCSGTDFDSVITAYTGSSLDGLTRVAQNNDTSGCGNGTRSRITFPVTNGTTYRIQVDAVGVGGTFKLSWNDSPPGDNFADAQTLTAGGGGLDGRLDGATSETDEPATCNGGPGCDGEVIGPKNTRWYIWTPIASGTARVDTCGTSTPRQPLLAAYSGTTLAGLNATRLAEAGSWVAGCGSVLTFPVTAGTPYRIQVDNGYNASLTGDPLNGLPYFLQWKITPGNDAFANATEVFGTSGTKTGSNTNATSESGEPQTCNSCNGFNVGPNRTVWYKWTAPNSGTATFDLCTGTSYDSTMAAYTGTALNALTRVANGDDNCGSQSRITFAATATATYWIQVDGWGSANGPFTLTWNVT